MLVFLSYKSEDANVVRGVGDRLIAAGVNVWFNDYRVLPEIYEQFEAEIDRGLADATHAVVFTNNRWSDAYWCRHEMRHLLAHLPPEGHLLEVCLPKEDQPHAVYSELTRVQPIVFRGDPRQPAHDDMDGLVAEIASRFRWPLAANSVRPVPGSVVTLPRFGTRVDPGPFNPSFSRTQALYRSNPTAGTRALIFTGRVGEVDVVLDLHVWPFASVLRDLSVRQAGAADDRKLYFAYLDYARKWIRGQKTLHLRSKGLHLVFIASRSHMGLTYTSATNAEGKALWERRYTISIEGEDEAEKGEVGLVFGVWLGGSDDEQLAAFCRLSPQLDAIAQSVRYETPSGAIAIASNAPILITHSAYAGGAAWLAWHVYRAGEPALVIGLACLLAGFVLGNLVPLLGWPLYRRLLWTTQPIVDDLAAPVSYERFSTDLEHNLISAPVWWFTLLTVTLKKALKRKALPLFLTAAACFYAWPGSSWVGARPSDPWALPLFVAGGVVLGGAFAALAVGEYVAAKRRVVRPEQG